MARVKYTVGGREFEMRTFHQRDWTFVRGKLTLLPTALPKGEPSLRDQVLGLEGAAQLLARCSINPKILVDYPATDPGPGFLPIDDLSDADFMELSALLSKDSGFTLEAAAEVRPSSATVEPS